MYLALVFHRIDDLEKALNGIYQGSDVFHRIDDLEKICTSSKTLAQVFHRIDDLENILNLVAQMG